MTSAKDITQEMARELLDYDPDTGHLTWRTRDVKWFTDTAYNAEINCKRWNNRFAGKRAGTWNNHHQRRVIQFTGSKTSSVFNKKFPVLEHRIIWLIVFGYWPHWELTHINGDHADNRIENLKEEQRPEYTRARAKHRVEITQAMAHELIDYDPDTGHLTWRKRDVKWFNANRKRSAESFAETWNKRWAGKRCGGEDSETGYRVCSMFGKLYYEHRLVWFYVYGYWPKEEIDHINNVRQDNRIANLRRADRALQSRNKSVHKNSKSGCRGVTWNKLKGKWQAKIQIDYKLRHLGFFDDVDDAIAARKKAEQEMY